MRIGHVATLAGLNLYLWGLSWCHTFPLVRDQEKVDDIQDQYNICVGTTRDSGHVFWRRRRQKKCMYKSLPDSYAKNTFNLGFLLKHFCPCGRLPIQLSIIFMRYCVQIICCIKVVILNVMCRN